MKTILVTGATGAIGKAIARNIAFNQNNHVVLVIRNESKGAKACNDIINITQNPNVEYIVVNLSDKTEIFQFSKNLETPVDILINNAATTPRQRLETEMGIELQWATNVLGYYWMISAFTEQLKNADMARVVNVASYWAGGMDLSDPEFKNRQYNNDSAYRQSKQANRISSGRALFTTMAEAK